MGYTPEGYVYFIEYATRAVLFVVFHHSPGRRRLTRPCPHFASYCLPHSHNTATTSWTDPRSIPGDRSPPSLSPRPASARPARRTTMSSKQTREQEPLPRIVIEAADGSHTELPPLAVPATPTKKKSKKVRLQRSLTTGTMATLAQQPAAGAPAAAATVGSSPLLQPAASASSPTSLHSSAEAPLPDGWEMAYNAAGVPYYIEYAFRICSVFMVGRQRLTDLLILCTGAHIAATLTTRPPGSTRGCSDQRGSRPRPRRTSCGSWSRH